MNCNELREHYELYAMGVLEEPEAGELREHLARKCPECQSGVRGARELITLVGATAPEQRPRARVRKRVLAAVGGGTDYRWFWAPAWGAVAAAALIAAFLFQARAQRAGADVARLKEAITGQTAELARLQSESAGRARELARLNTALSILNQPEVKQVVFGGGKPQPPRGRVFIDAQRGVLLVASNLPPAPAGKLWEMWVIPKGGKPVPAGMFQSSEDKTAINVLPGPVDVASTGAVAVTLEVEAGVAQPTSTPVIVASL